MSIWLSAISLTKAGSVVQAVPTADGLTSYAGTTTTRQQHSDLWRRSTTHGHSGVTLRSSMTTCGRRRVCTLWSPKIRNPVQGEHPHILHEKGVRVVVCSRKHVLSVKGTRLQLITNGKLHLCSSDWYQNQWPWITVNGHMHSVSKYMHLWEPTTNTYCSIAQSSCGSMAFLYALTANMNHKPERCHFRFHYMLCNKKCSFKTAWTTMQFTKLNTSIQWFQTEVKIKYIKKL